MSAQQLSELSEGQISCLRLVARGMSSKEIARATGLSHYTVDTYIKRALPVVGASNRRDAARIVVRSEQSQKIGSPPESVVFQSDSAILNPATSHRSSNATLSSVFDLPKIGGGVNDLAWVERHYAIIKVAALGFSVILAITLASAGILWVFE
ncbi:helix-turn-helix domain-containing protein [Parasphingopyxis lamellibrachiae]|uniref:Regulatory LuxR family protein n=1 Tax=Parasphingopyxis lamellibrachiae TaxID=680125 RepID=A0A3D9FKU4_9SPHN|nr:helix-turn-helix transcriptional regulator [Parasphingopyxis lamellibrachiae]RED17726.1 regulatory LuxR family protein [Parasphingopyxis lamellibrachiae]